MLKAVINNDPLHIRAGPPGKMREVSQHPPQVLKAGKKDPAALPFAPVGVSKPEVHQPYAAQPRP